MPADRAAHELSRLRRKIHPKQQEKPTKLNNYYETFWRKDKTREADLPLEVDPIV
jgi:hypothetical protein